MPKTILVVTSDVPFVHGGHRVIADELVRALTEIGHRAELVRTPSNRFGRTLQAYLATRLTDVGLTGYGEPVDHVISLRYPAFAVRHDSHVAWVVHRMREYYDLWEHLVTGLSRQARLKEEIRRRIIHGLDRRLLVDGTRQVYCISDTVRRRLEQWGEIPARTLHPPAPARAYRTDRYEPYVFAVSRLHRWKRMHLLVEALAHDRSLRAVIAGDGPERPALAARARELGVEERVELIGAIDEDALLDHYARAGAVFFAPLNEDYGFVTVEAFMARKPVVTCHDSGGVTELVRNGESGFVCAPAPAALGAALARLMSDPRLAEKLGEGGHETAARLSWPETARTLVEAGA